MQTYDILNVHMLHVYMHMRMRMCVGRGQTLIKFLLLTAAVAHWLACVWGFAGRMLCVADPNTPTGCAVLGPPAPADGGGRLTDVFVATARGGQLGVSRTWVNLLGAEGAPPAALYSPS